MKFEITEEQAKQLVRIVNEWAEAHSLIECTGNPAILWKYQELEPAIKNWKDEEE